ncbi:MAG: hypothetical protein LZF62_340143 [Nitrospira sp.]|nr:MAG: hypothetical protein LZF62_340143 [Nitrospira sp.]
MPLLHSPILPGSLGKYYGDDPDAAPAAFFRSEWYSLLIVLLLAKSVDVQGTIETTKFLTR